MSKNIDKIAIPDIKCPVVGATVPFSIKGIVMGALKELVDKDTVAKWTHSNPSDPFALITVSNEDYGEQTQLIPMPMNDKGIMDLSRINFRHTLARFKDKYHSDMQVGLTVEMRYEADKNFKLVV